MIHESDKQVALETILNSSEFKDSATYRELLAYLFKATQRNETPKEMTIAQDVFGKKEFDNEKDASIRVYVYNLRKKLDSYYLREGKNSKIRISIPKGHYLLSFSENESAKLRPATKHLILINLFFIIIVIIANLFLWQRHTSQETRDIQPLNNNLIWGDILKSDLPTLIVIGDYFLYQDSASIYNYFIRNPQINNDQDFQNLISETPSQRDQFQNTNLTFLGIYTIWCFNDIIHPLVRSNVSVDLRLASNLQWRDFQNNNIIFIGALKTLRIMKTYLSNLNFDYQVYPNTLFYNDPQNGNTYNYHGPKNEESGFVKDYAVVAKLPGPNKNTIMVFSSTHDIGHMSVVESFTNPEYLQQFEEDYLIGEKDVVYFESIFEVQGFERTGFFPMLLHFNDIDADYEYQMR